MRMSTKLTALLGSLLLSAGAAHGAEDDAPGMMNDRPMMNGMMDRSRVARGMMGDGGMMMDDGMMGRMGMMDHGAMTGMRFEHLMRLPDLSDDQRAALRTRHRELQRELHQLGGEALDARFALQDLAAQATPDPKAVDAALQNLHEVHRRMAVAAVTAHNEAYETLTSEQREALEQRSGMGMRSGMHGRMQQQMQQR